MQHYRLPTRLLDWADSLLIATYFAVCCGQENEDEPADDAQVWALCPAALNSVMVGQGAIFPLPSGDSDRHPMLPSLLEMPFLAENGREALWEKCVDHVMNPELPHRFALAVMPRHIDIRMGSQASRFSLHMSSTPLEQHSRASEFLGYFSIPAPYRSPLRKELWSLGIRPTAAFPDLAGLASELRQHADLPGFKDTETNDNTAR